MEHQLVLLLIGSLTHTNRDDFQELSSQNLISFVFLYSVEIFVFCHFVLEMGTQQELVMERILFFDQNQREPDNVINILEITYELTFDLSTPDGIVSKRWTISPGLTQQSDASPETHLCLTSYKFDWYVSSIYCLSSAV